MDDSTPEDPSATRGENDFWGSTPDWTGSAQRPQRKPGGPEFSGRVKGWWSNALTGGANPTREHRVIDATKPRSAPFEQTRADVDPTMFDDLDTDFVVTSSDRTDERFLDTTSLATLAALVTNDAPRQHLNESGAGFETDADAHAGYAHIDQEDFDADRAMLAFAPTSMIAPRDPDGRSAFAIDPLLARLGAVGIVLTLAVPLVVGWNSRRDDSEAVATATVPTAEVVLDEVGSESTSAPSVVDTSPETTSNATVAPTTVDIESLPAATPASTDAPFNTPTVGAGAVTEPTPADEPSREEDSASANATTPADELNSGAEADGDATRVNVCAIDYTVQAGDFWIRLAEGAGVPLAELLEANGATIDTPLYPGQTICLPAGSKTPPAPTTTTPSTTTASTTAPTTTAPAATGEAAMKQIIRDVWPDDLEERALEIANRESRFVPTAKNFCCYGLFQIYFEVHKSWLDDLGVTRAEQLFDPLTNARAAYTLYQRSGGWGPWQL